MTRPLFGRRHSAPRPTSGLSCADDASTFETEVLQSPVPVVVDFWAAWCGPCRRVGPEIEELATLHGEAIKVVKVDVEANRKIAKRYDVRSIPTIALFRDGRLVGRSIGAKRRAAIETDLGLVPRGTRQPKDS